MLLFTVSARGTDRALRFVLRLLYRLRIVRRPQHRYSRIHTQMSVFHKSAGLMGRSFRLYCTTALLTVVQITVQSLISWFIYKSFALAGEQVPVITMVAAQVFVSMVSAFVPLPGASRRRGGLLRPLLRQVLWPGYRGRHVPLAFAHILCQHRVRRLVLRLGRKKISGQNGEKKREPVFRAGSGLQKKRGNAMKQKDVHYPEMPGGDPASGSDFRSRAVSSPECGIRPRRRGGKDLRGAWRAP